jgi:hypothetical protein
MTAHTSESRKRSKADCGSLNAQKKSGPKKVYIVEHASTNRHFGGEKMIVERKGVFYEALNAVLRGVEVVKEELSINLNDTKVMLEFLACEDIQDERELDDPDVCIGHLLLILMAGVEEEVETEGVDDHLVSIKIVDVEDATEAA